MSIIAIQSFNLIKNDQSEMYQKWDHVLVKSCLNYNMSFALHIVNRGVKHQCMIPLQQTHMHCARSIPLSACFHRP